MAPFNRFFKSSFLHFHDKMDTSVNYQRRMYELVQPPWYGKNEGDYKILLAFSGLQHALSSKPGYNLRVAECQEAATVLLRYFTSMINFQPFFIQISPYRGIEMECTAARFGLKCNRRT